MSALALKWAYSQKVGNAVAKNILGYLASHNFGGNKSCFKVKYIMAATEYQETAVRQALQLLVSKNLIIKNVRFGDKGQQLSNEYILNIPEAYENEFYESYMQKSVDNFTTPPSPYVPPPIAERTPPYRVANPLNNKINNKINKRSVSSNIEKKKTEMKSTAQWFNDNH